MEGQEWQGKVIDGRYVVEAVLGHGGMGLVLRARHKFTGALVALKMLHGHLRLRGDLANRFLAEARAPGCRSGPCGASGSISWPRSARRTPPASCTAI